MKEETWAQQAEWRATEPGVWFSKACQFRRASTLVWEQHKSAVNAMCAEPQAFFVSNDPFDDWTIETQFLEVSDFLLACAIELSLKALIVKCEPQNAGEKWFNTHRLTKLVKRAGIQALTPEESYLLELLTHVIEWKGRYPVPRRDKPKWRENWMSLLNLQRHEPSGKGEGYPGHFTPIQRQHLQQLSQKIFDVAKREFPVAAEPSSGGGGIAE